jgi:hypothetical protein
MQLLSPSDTLHYGSKDAICQGSHASGMLVLIAFDISYHAKQKHELLVCSCIVCCTGGKTCRHTRASLSSADWAQLMARTPDL